MTLNAEQLDALRLAQQGHSVYIGGQAGTGKTFLVQEIVRSLKKRGKTIALTCTTGIACSLYPTTMRALTIHKWSGLGDGRFNDVPHLIMNDERFSSTRDTIRSTDTLIIDEISMLSLKLFDLVQGICCIRGGNTHFGGIQVICVGDFFQLPPVPNPRYKDSGEFCFKSEFFPSHAVYLRHNQRQHEEGLTSLVREFSKGNTSKHLEHYAKTLSRPLSSTTGQDETVRLYANNCLVNIHNRDRILKEPGELFEFEAIDSGNMMELNKLIVQKTIWLKVDARVILLRNLSDTLVNGLRGTVRKIEDEIVTVFFESVNLVVPITRLSFTVFDPSANRNIAERYQVPLKLAYAMTIHKAQGMTLSRVEVDCRQLFAPGHLGVAIGRVQSEEGLRLINFSSKVVIQQPDTIQVFHNKCSSELQEDFSCCHIECKDISTQENGSVADESTNIRKN